MGTSHLPTNAAHAPRATPLKTDIVGKYTRHPHEGGWAAEELTLDLVDNQEPDFSHIDIFEQNFCAGTFSARPISGNWNMNGGRHTDRGR